MKCRTGYRVVGREEALNSRALAAALVKDGQALLPIVELITNAQVGMDEAIDVAGRATGEAVLELSAHQVAGAPHQGRKGTGVQRHGHQGGAVRLSDRTLRVRRPRLRDGAGEVAIPAYASLQEHPGAGAKMMDTLLRGGSTRNYRGGLRGMADTAGGRKSGVVRGVSEHNEEALR